MAVVDVKGGPTVPCWLVRWLYGYGRKFVVWLCGLGLMGEAYSFYVHLPSPVYWYVFSILIYFWWCFDLATLRGCSTLI